jgi:hypothetical protein
LELNETLIARAPIILDAILHEIGARIRQVSAAPDCLREAVARRGQGGAYA